MAVHPTGAIAPSLQTNMKASRARFAAVAALVLAACSASPGGDAKKHDDVVIGTSYASIGHRDDRLGVPTFAWISKKDLPAFSTAREAASGVAERVTQAFRLHDGMLSTLDELVIDEAKRGPVIAKWTQKIDGVEVFRGGVAVAMTRAYEPVSASGFLAPTREGANREYVVDAARAVSRAIDLVTGSVASRAVTAFDTRDEYTRFTAPGLARPARAKKVLFPKKTIAAKGLASVELVPSWYVEAFVKSGPARSVVVSGLDGKILFQNDLVRHDAYTYRVFADPTTKLPMDGPQGNGYAPHPTGTPDKQKPAFVAPQDITLQNFPFSKNDPWLPPGATTTDGNNVHAYADRIAPSGFDAVGDVAPVLTGANAFATAFDTTKPPSATAEQAMGATQHLFYTLNFLHDWFYDAGFDEAGLNHQSDNFGRGGKGVDPLLAEAQDNSGRNNANAQVPADGDSPIIQMFIFAGPSNSNLTVNTPAGIAGVKSTGIASGFGKDAFDLTGDVILAADGQGADVADACEPLTNDVQGKIVLAHRGTCSFAQKASNAEAGGAVGCIIANVASSVQPTFAPFMGGTANGITIPLLSLNLANGQAIEGALATGAVNVRMFRAVAEDLDGALDTSIVAHEWGHVLSSRLVGNASGLATNQSGGLGEGWGDFVALMLAVRPDDPGGFSGAYANGSYATHGSGDDIYFGTRRLPYSTDFTKNALTFKHIMSGVPLPIGVATSFGEDGGSNSEVHNTGEVWATMLWECYAALLKDSGRLPFEEAQTRMRRYLVAALKLTPPDPTLLEARDALLSAAVASDEADFKLFWEAFARRGAGAGAVGPSKDSPTNGPVIESFFAGNEVQIAEAKLLDDVITCDRDNILDEGEVGTIELKLRNSGSGTVTETVAKALSKTAGVTFESTDTKLPTLKPFESTTLKIKTHITGLKPVDAIELEVALDDATFAPGHKVTVKIPTYFHADEAPDSSASDPSDTTKTAWKVDGEDTFGTSVPWAQFRENENTYWTIPNSTEASDHLLISPKFTIEDTTFSLSFKHRWSFRISQRRAADIDGGVIEISTDGRSWEDISKYGSVDYNTTLDTGGRGDNILKGRKAYGNTSKGYPDQWITTKVDVQLPEHPEQVQVRFRVGTGSGFRPADGWDLDDFELGGITSKPFFAFVAHQDLCDPNAPSAFAGDSRTVGRGTNVTLNGSAEAVEGSGPLTFLWKQVEGPTVQLEDKSGPTPRFIAIGDPGTKLGFELRVHDGKLLSPMSRVDITVDPTGGPSGADDTGCSCKTTPLPRARASASAPTFIPSALALALLALLTLRRRKN